MADKTLKLCGEPILPGLALPKAFEDLENQFESIRNLCKRDCSHEAQTAGVLLICNELQRLLRLAFIENGILSSRIEILTRYQDDFINKVEKRIKGFEIEQKLTRKYLKSLRMRQYNYEKIKKCRQSNEWWKVDITNTDYESINGLARTSGSPNLEFMLRLNQLLLDFVEDPYTNELLLPPMGTEERAELSKLASLYKLRCRFNKSTQVATSTIIKARQTCVPASGEVDSILNLFTKKQKDDEIEHNDNVANDEVPPTTSVSSSPPTAPPISGIDTPPTAPPKPVSTMATKTLPSHMLTPVSSMGTPTITLEAHDATFNKVNPSVRVTKIEGNKPLLQLLPDTPTQPTSNQQGLSSNYTNLLSSAGAPPTFASPSPAALHMALLMQSQQLRALTAAVNAGQSTIASSSTTNNTIVSSSPASTATVLATPLPHSLTANKTNIATVVQATNRKRENTTTTAAKRSKIKKTSD